MKEITDANFKEVVLESTKPVVLDIWAPWCGPCRMIAPILEQLSDEHANVEFVKCNVDENPGVAQKFGIRSIPTVLFFKNGEIVDTAVGALPKNMFESKIGNL